MDAMLAIDLGTRGPKVALVGVDGALLAQAFEPVELHLGEGGAAEQDPHEWWQALRRAVGRLESADRPVRVIAVCPTGQWSGTVALDAQGEPLMRAMIWLDSRGTEDVRRLIGGPIRVEGYDPRKLRTWVSRTGGAPGKSGRDPIAHIRWLQRERPEVYAATDVFLEPKDYLLYRLTGERVATTDSIALHWVTDNRNLSAVRYDPLLIEMAGIERDKLPDLIAPTDIAGELTEAAAADLGLEAGVPVVGGSPDVHSAAVGSGAVGDFEAHLYVGTSNWLSCHVPFKKTDVIRNVAAVPAAIPRRYLVVNEQSAAGACLEFLADNLLLDVPADRDGVFGTFDELAAQAPPGSGGALFMPWLFGERTPVEDAALRASFFNLSMGTDHRHLVRAVFEGVAYNVRWLLGAVERFTKQRLDPIRMVGGGARSAVWTQIFADVLDRTVQPTSDPGAVNLRGAAVLGLLGLNRVSVSGISTTVPISTAYEPTPGTRALHDARFHEFLMFHKSNRKALRRINRG